MGVCMTVSLTAAHGVDYLGFTGKASELPKKKGRPISSELNPNPTGLPNCLDPLRHTDRCSRRTSRLCIRSCYGGQELTTACLKATVTGVASVDVTAVYRHPPTSTPGTLRRVLSLRIAPWLPDTHLFMGSPLADVRDAMVPSSDQAPLPDLISPGFL